MLELRDDLEKAMEEDMRSEDSESNIGHVENDYF